MEQSNKATGSAGSLRRLRRARRQGPPGRWEGRSEREGVGSENPLRTEGGVSDPTPSPTPAPLRLCVRHREPTGPLSPDGGGVPSAPRKALAPGVGVVLLPHDPVDVLQLEERPVPQLQREDASPSGHLVRILPPPMRPSGNRPLRLQFQGARGPNPPTQGPGCPSPWRRGIRASKNRGQKIHFQFCGCPWAGPEGVGGVPPPTDL